jgi:hypothetical protein
MLYLCRVTDKFNLIFHNLQFFLFFEEKQPICFYVLGPFGRSVFEDIHWFISFSIQKAGSSLFCVGDLPEIERNQFENSRILAYNHESGHLHGCEWYH